MWLLMKGDAVMTFLARQALLVIALYLRITPFVVGKRNLLRLCRQHLLRRQAAFSADVVLVMPRSSLPAVSARCFQLGGRNADVLSEWLFFTGGWQPALSSYLQRVLQPGDVFVDVGANTGILSLLAAACGASAVAIEACPKTFARLRSNLALNPELKIRALQVAAAEVRLPVEKRAGHAYRRARPICTRFLSHATVCATGFGQHHALSA